MKPEIQEQMKEEILHFEQTASRFIKGNALDFVNSASLHSPIFMEQELFELLKRSLRLAKLAHYYVHPFVGEEMKNAGYVSSFSERELIFETPMSDSTNERSLPFRLPVELLTNQWIIKKQPFSFDFGGFGKGLIVDRLKERFYKDEENWLVNAGGDLLINGTMTAGIEHPVHMGQDMIRLQLENAALATSGKNYRKWNNGHHILNGRTGKPANNGVLQASVIAKTVMEAETAAKIFCILPYKEARALLQKNFPGIAYFVYFEDHQLVTGGNPALYKEMEVAR
ncbi:FAD:protein FMN transferase [Fictibacillus fluitans]|uniref:FAD:protein FMN transferase n=1 Tax=Fictibacillus fluitans TaxID=3058422 RepID=A0ABT8HY65_9BACL|nr:FAD:protein FMN transferase [Fictibacillus sp. NE201]MDN4525721.1 FAD:protein FMN transferase [Fictibacillus sp. NE201]